MKKDNPTLQELAEFLRNAAYADDQSHGIDWSLNVIHPRTNDGDVGFSGGLWTRDGVWNSDHTYKKAQIYISLSYSYSETRGIYGVKRWKDRCEIFTEDKTMPFEKFKEIVISLFGIERLYDPESKGKSAQ